MYRDLSIQPATRQDEREVRRLLQNAELRHEHLDWTHPLDLLDQGPFLLARSGRECVACLACSPDLPGSAWVRLFMVAPGLSPSQAWTQLWRPALDLLIEGGVSEVGALPIENRLAPMLEGAGFRRTDEVVFLAWEAPPPPSTPAPAALRGLRLGDLPAVAAVDQLAFAPLWQLSEQSLRQAFEQAEVATVAVSDGRLVGYQVSTASSLGAHLARLAVHPDFQRRGLGSMLVSDALGQLHRRGFDRATVNTQRSNLPSLALYDRLGFRRSGLDYPVYTLSLGSGLSG